MALKINRHISAYNSSSRSGNTIKYIVIHYVGGVSTAQNNVKYFAGGDRQASAHYFVGHEGDIWQSVEESRSAWHCGGGLQGSGGHAWHGKCKNANSIGIEMCVRKNGSTWYFEDATVNTTIELTKHLMKKYNIPASNVIRHYDVTGKICPAPYVHNNTKHTWTEFKNALGGKATETVSKGYLCKGDKGEDVAEMQRMLIALGYDLGESGADGSFGPISDSVVRKYQEEHGLEVDGSYGPLTKASVTANYNALKNAQTNTGELFRVQVGAFKDKKLAEELVKTLKSKGFDAIIKES
jgi:N-acetyl-anhydromuramyl-L-alanine amidase AmpD